MLFKLDDIDSAAQLFIKNVDAGDIIALSGPLAAGKTTLTKEILKQMGYIGRVSSPTFVLERRYPVKFKKITEVIHLDFYRLSEDQVNSFGWQEYLELNDVLVIIEWPERIELHLPQKTKKFKLEIIDDNTRRLEIR